MAIAEGLKRPLVLDHLRLGTQNLSDTLALKTDNLLEQINFAKAEIKDQVEYGLFEARISVFTPSKNIDEARRRAKDRGRIAGAITTIFTANSYRDPLDEIYE